MTHNGDYSGNKNQVMVIEGFVLMFANDVKIEKYLGFFIKSIFLNDFTFITENAIYLVAV